MGVLAFFLAFVGGRLKLGNIGRSSFFMVVWPFRLTKWGRNSIAGIPDSSAGILTALFNGRSRLSLALAEREEISRGVIAGYSIRSIATSLGRAPSTVSREVNRNGVIIAPFQEPLGPQTGLGRCESLEA